MSIRESYVEHFGESEAVLLEMAAEVHKNGVHDDKGSDAFKWVVAICIGYQCVEKEEYREWHKIGVEFEVFRQWVKEFGELGSHDGDVDYISALIGIYDEYMEVKG